MVFMVSTGCVPPQAHPRGEPPRVAKICLSEAAIGEVSNRPPSRGSR